jgi:hypothetical protein
VDRRAHGDVPFLEWYLKQFAAAERKSGRRLLDFLDIHGYIAPDEVQFKSAGDTALQQMRLDAVRAFWIRHHVAGGINDQPFLAAHATGSRNYPGTLTAITEVTWARSITSTARLRRPICSAFSARRPRPRGDLGPPSEAEPGLYSFKIFRNYDDGGNGFGDVSVRAASADQSRLRYQPLSDRTAIAR